MHFYNFNVSNYQAHTSHLDNLEDLAYRRMLDYCYFHEEPLPKDVKQISKLIRMRDECERIADVLQEFFIDEEEGYFHSKVNAEIDRYRTKSEKAKASAKARWDRKTLKNKVLGSDANALRTDCEGNAKEELRKKKEERITNKEIVIPEGINIESWNEWFTYRKEKKKTVSQAAAKKQFNLLAKYTTEQQKLIIDTSIQNDYQGLFEPKANNTVSKNIVNIEYGEGRGSI